MTREPTNYGQVCCSIHLYMYISIHLYTSLYVHLYTSLYVHLYTSLDVHLYMYISICTSLCEHIMAAVKPLIKGHIESESRRPSSEVKCIIRTKSPL